MEDEKLPPCDSEKSQERLHSKFNVHQKKKKKDNKSLGIRS
jgi:hypothetical protein